MKLLLLVLGLVFGLSTQAQAASGPEDSDVHTLTFCYENKQLLPHFVGNTSSIPAYQPGAAIDIVRALDEQLPNVNFELVRYPWNRCLRELETGKVHSVIGRFTDMRAAFSAFPRVADGTVDKSRAFSKTTACFMFNENYPIEWDGKTISKPDGLILSVTRGYQMVEDLRHFGFEIYETKSSDLAHDLLFNHRVQASLGNCNEPNLPKYIVELQKPFFENYGYLMLNKAFAQKHPAVSDLIWNTLAQIDKPAFYKAYSQ